MRRVIEISTSGYDEYLQLVGSDPQGTANNVGLRVPTLATGSLANPFDSRYLFMLAAFAVSEGTKATILGYRQMITLGYLQPTFTVDPDPPTPARVIEQQITSPFWHPPDGNVSWHLRKLGPPNAQGLPSTGQAPTMSPSAAYRFSMAPSLLFEAMTIPAKGDSYTTLTAYTPPKKGRPWGDTLTNGHQGNFYDLRAGDWNTHGAWTSLDRGVDIEGPETVAFFASIRQPDPANNPPITVPTTFFGNGLMPEEQFLLNWPSAIYWRVAGSLIIQLECG